MITRSKSKATRNKEAMQAAIIAKIPLVDRAKILGLGSSSGAGSSASVLGEDEFVIQSCHPMFYKGLDLGGCETCPICKINLNHFCIKCNTLETQELSAESCTVTFGVCGHNFHTHCWLGWTDGSGFTGSCPIDTNMFAVLKVL